LSTSFRGLGVTLVRRGLRALVVARVRVVQQVFVVSLEHLGLKAVKVNVVPQVPEDRWERSVLVEPQVNVVR
jgi:hypothetical protein